MKTLSGFHVGQRVVMTARRGSFYVLVSKIGRRYVYVEHLGREYQFDPRDEGVAFQSLDASGRSGGRQIYVESVWEERAHRVWLLTKIREVDVDRLPTETLERLVEVLS